jgi:anaphase-promoting complex subunit 8
MGKQNEAVKCTERVERVKDKESIALHKLARLYAQMGDIQKAAICFEENLARKDQENIESSETIEAYLFLAKYYKDKGDFNKALDCARPLQDYSGTEREEANKLIREINSLA